MHERYIITKVDNHADPTLIIILIKKIKLVVLKMTAYIVDNNYYYTKKCLYNLYIQMSHVVKAQPATELVSVVHSCEIGTLVNTECG